MSSRKSSEKHRQMVEEQQEKYRQTEAEPGIIYLEQDEIPLLEERYEIIDGIRYELKPSPGLDHQLLVTKLSSDLQGTCHRHGIVIVAPMDVHLNGQNILQPDVIFISNANMSIIQGQRIVGAPDLVVEILSPHSGKIDKICKKAIYERFGVPEFWIVDPLHETIDQFLLEQEKYHLQGTYSDEHIMCSPKLVCIGIDLKALFQSKMQYRKGTR